jgi:hypothetical protein
MLEYKITNKVFDTEWDEVCKKAPGKVTPLVPKKLVPEMWRKDENGAPLDINGVDANLPVLGVTLPQAILVAERLNGKIPTLRQWQKAAGVLEDGVLVGPAGAPLTALERKTAADVFRNRKLALGLPKSLPVTDPRAEGDVSKPWKIRQLVSNGREWIAQAPGPPVRLELDPLPDGQQFAIVVGKAADESYVEPVTDLRQNRPEQYPWGDPAGERKEDEKGVYAGFRLVLEVP